MREIQKKIAETYDRVFPNTTQTERLEDLQKQFFKLMRSAETK